MSLCIRFNGSLIDIPDAILGYDDICELAGFRRGAVITVVYDQTVDGVSSRGTLRRGQALKPFMHMRIHAMATNNA